MPLTKLLQSAGWPTDTLVIDFETYFDTEYSLKKMSMMEYVNDERFEVLGVATRMGDYTSFVEAEQLESFLRMGVNPPHAPLNSFTLLMHNAYFDCLILRTYGIHPKYVLDTRNMSRHVFARSKHSLKNLAQAYDLPLKGDTMQFKGLRLADMTQEQRSALAEYACNDAEITYQLALRLAPLISNPETELWTMQHTLDLFLHSPLLLDGAWATRLQARMRKKLVHALAKAMTSPKEVNSPKRLSKRLVAAGAVIPMKQGKAGPIPCFAKTDEGYAKLLDHENKDVRSLVRARQAVKTWPTQIQRIDTLVNQTDANGGNLPVYLNYYGAGTGRFSGGDGTNLQNLSTRSPHRLQNLIRTLIVAPPGQTLVVVDAAQIEARGTDWVSGQEDYLELWRQNKPIYELFAQNLYRCPLEEIKGKKRQAGKVGILGCGFGMGWRQARVFAKNTYKIDLTDAEAKALVNVYRSTHDKVVYFWKAIEHFFKFTVAYKATREFRGLRSQWEPNEDIVSIQLPNSRKLYYHSPRVSGDTITTVEHPHLWGGVLTENIVQAMARDVLVDNIRALERQGLHVCHHVHDEVVICVDENEANSVLEKTIQVFKTPPAWAPDWPVSGAGKTMRRYGK